jgi:hypothetical protein
MPCHTLPSIDKPTAPTNNCRVLFNSGTGFGDPTDKADSRSAAIFMSVAHHWYVLFYGGPWWGYLRVCRFPYRRFANLAMRLPPSFGDEAV